ncbi:hypothetical protein AB833_01210 [Chromatiales bacterium (ex Bugula neritina AB1)]|nr:hypothetical protein AB833_01210 [Chromatiales bacterium (ex Bugula neritina AB1)]
MNIRVARNALCVLACATVAGCGGSSGGSVTSGSNAVGAVYAMTNAADTNTVVAYARAADGTLTLIGSAATEGQGSGPTNVASGPGGNAIDPLASNYALVMSTDNRFVFAVNAGSDEVSSFIVNSDFSLSHVSTVASGGSAPVSIATIDNAIFVANSNAGVGTITSFTVSETGALTSAGGEVTLAGRPTAISLTKDKNTLIATLVDTLQLQVYSVANTALTETSLFSYPAPPEGRNVANPFGLDTFEHNGAQFAIVADARVFAVNGTEPDPQTSSVTTFSVSGGQLSIVSDDIRADDDGDDSVGPITACWAVTNADGTMAFIAKTNDNSITSYNLNESGEAVLSASTAFAEDGDFTEDGLTDQFVIGNVVYQLVSAAGSVLSLSINADTGVLTEIDRDTDLSLVGGNQGITGF